MDKTNNTILVLGATGNQGGAVAEKLLANGWDVRAVSRDINKPAAQELRNKGAMVIQADMNDNRSLLEAMQGVYGVYSVQPMYTTGPDKEIQHGKAVADAAKKSGVDHFVYGSVGGANRNSGIPHFETKWQVEKHIRTIKLPYTILRPAFFMENFLDFTQVSQQILQLQGFMNTDIKLQMISVQDIGEFAELAFKHPDTYKGKSIEIAGDELNLAEVGNLMRNEFNSSYEILESARENFQKNKMFAWFETDGYNADIPSLRKEHPEMLDVTAWLKTSGWNPFG